MADRRLRELERAFAETGALDDELALLRHRVRTGDLHPAWLEAAARLGHKAARKLMDRFLPVLTWEDLLERVPDWGPRARALSAIDPERAAAPVWREDDARRLASAKRARTALIPWALANGEGAPAPPEWPTDDGLEAVRPLDPGAVREAEERFRARAAAPEVQAQAKVLRKRRRDLTLLKERLDVAADLAHPAAWVVSRRKRLPDLRPLGAGSALPGRLNELLQAYGQPTRRRRRAYRDRGGELVVHAGAADKPWPEWGAPLAIRIGIALAEHVLPAFGAAEPRLLRAIEAAKAYLGCPCEEHVKQARAAFRSAQGVVKATRDARAQAAARVAAAVAQLAGRALRAWDPGLGEGTYDLTREAERAGYDPEELWDVAREAGAAWALGEDDLPGAERPYSPRERFGEGEAIAHPAFGVGVVRVVRGKKIDVEFATGVKTLVHAG